MRQPVGLAEGSRGHQAQRQRGQSRVLHGVFPWSSCCASTMRRWQQAGRHARRACDRQSVPSDLWPRPCASGAKRLNRYRPQLRDSRSEKPSGAISNCRKFKARRHRAAHQRVIAQAARRLPGVRRHHQLRHLGLVDIGAQHITCPCRSSIPAARRDRNARPRRHRPGASARLRPP